nr:hypothetical protein [uncultured Tolumonas sp.]
MNKKKKSIRYQWHPTLLRIYSNTHFQWLLAQGNTSVCKQLSFHCEPVLYQIAADANSHEDEEVRLISYPLLLVSLWSSQSEPLNDVLLSPQLELPNGVLLFKKQLSNEDLENLIISELLRLICFSPKPDESLCECVRLLINSTISSSIRMIYFGENRLSQTFFGQKIGLTRKQMASGAAKIRAKKKQQKQQKKKTSSVMDINFFNEVLS